LLVLLVARLLTNEHDPRTLRAGPEDHLRRGLIQVTASAFLCRRLENLQAGRRRDERFSGHYEYDPDACTART